MNKKTSLSLQQQNTLVRLAQGARLMVDSEDRIWIDQQRIFANTFFALRTRKLIARSPQTTVGQKVFKLSKEGQELLNGRATPCRVRGQTMPLDIKIRFSFVSVGQGTAVSEHGPGRKLGLSFQAPDRAPRLQWFDPDLSWLAWVLLAALTGLLGVLLTT